MPWTETDVMKERVKFVLEWERRWNEGEGRVNMAALCRAFGISRQTGYVWVRRYQEGGWKVDALEERSTHRQAGWISRPLTKVYFRGRTLFAIKH